MRRPLFWVCLLLSLAACLHFWLTGGFDPGGGAESIPELQKKAVFVGRVCGKETGNPKNSFLIQIDLSFTDQLTAPSQQILFYLKQKNTKKLRCYPEAEDCEGLPEIGSEVLVEGTFEAYESATNPGEFDFEKYCRANGIGGTLTKTLILQKSEKYDRIGENLFRLREFLGERLCAVFPEKEAGVMKTMLLGDRSDLDPELKKLYREGGIVHILSISGLHITLLGMGIYRFLRKLGAPNGAAAVAGGVFLALYGIMTGMSVSACRAIGMFLLRMLSLLLGRTYDLLTALSVLAAGMLCLNPGYLLHSGFWLSFGSLFGVGCILPALEDLAEEPGWLTRSREKKEALGFEMGNDSAGKKSARFYAAVKTGFWSAVCSLGQTAGEGLRGGAAVLLATLPLQLYFYCEIPVYSMAVNLPVLACMGVVVGNGFLAMVTGLRFFGILDTIVLRGFEQLCRGVESIPFHTWNPGAPKIWQIALYYVGLILVLFGALRWKAVQEKRREKGIPEGYCLKKSRRGRVPEKKRKCCWEEWKRFLLKWFILLLPAAVLALPVHRMTGLTFLDVGQGDAVCIRLENGQTWIYDCGSTSRSRVGENVLIPYLKHEGIDRISGVFLSHDDQDHCSGLLELFASAQKGEIRIDRVILPELGKERETDGFAEIMELGQEGCFDVLFVKAGDKIRSGGSSFLVLNPREKTGETAPEVTTDKNAMSLCILAEITRGEEKKRVLLTGDAERTGEKAMLEELEKQGVNFVNVLKCAHHGSKNATSEEFLNCISVQTAVISCGRKNSYGHPHREVLERLEDAGVRVFRTDESGAVSLYIREGGMYAETFGK